MNTSTKLVFRLLSSPVNILLDECFAWHGLWHKDVFVQNKHLPLEKNLQRFVLILFAVDQDTRNFYFFVFRPFISLFVFPKKYSLLQRALKFWLSSMRAVYSSLKSVFEMDLMCNNNNMYTWYALRTPHRLTNSLLIGHRNKTPNAVHAFIGDTMMCKIIRSVFVLKSYVNTITNLIRLFLQCEMRFVYV